MAERGDNGRPTAAAGLRDFLVLGARALASGVVVAVTLGFAALVLAHNAQAAGPATTDAPADAAPQIYTGDTVVVAAAAPAFRETLIVSAPRDNEPWSVAPGSTGPTRPDEPGALWAKAPKAQPDTAATLLLLLGLLALGAVSIVAVIGRGARGARA
jgi:hypothetical protein